MTLRVPLRRALSSLALPLAAIGLVQLMPCAQAQSVLPVTSGLQCWFDAAVGVTGSGTGVTGWADQSGNGHTATKTAGTLTLISGALNGRPAIQFSNNAVASMTGNMYSKTQFIVTKMNGGDWGAWMGSQVRGGYMWNQSGNCWDQNVPAAASKNGTALTNPFFLGADRATNYMIVKIVGNDTNTSQRLYDLGRTEGWSSLHNFMAEIIVYNRVLTATEENLVGGYLNKKYAVSTTYPAYPLMASVTSPADTQAYPTNTSVTAVATVPSLSGTGPYTVQFYKKTGAGDFAAEGSPLTGAGPTFSLPLGTLGDNTYQIYATVLDSAASPATATSATNTFTVAPPIPTTTTLGSSPNPSTYGQSVTFTATVSGPPTGGTVQFYDGANPLGSPVAVNTGTGAASYSTTLLTAATHSITASFSSHGVYLASNSSVLTQMVTQAGLTVTADNKVRSPGTANPTFTYKITGYQNGENATSAGISGAPVLSCLADGSSAVGTYAITCAPGSLSAANYSFTIMVNGTLTVMAGAPPVASGMTCWYDAANGVTANGSSVVTTWNDLSGNAHHATSGSGSPTLVASQINGKPAIQFRSSHLNCAGSLFTATQYLVLKSPTVTWTGGGTFMGPSDVRIYDMYNGQSGTLYGGFWTDPAPVGVSRDGNVIAIQSGNNFGYPLHPPEINAQYFILKINVNTTAKAGAGVARSYQIGRSADVGYVNFDVAEIIGYETILSADDEKSLGRYLADKYAIAAPNYPLVNPPVAPPALVAEPLPRSVGLTWTASYSATSYNVYRGTESGVYGSTAIATGISATTYTDSAVVVGTPYFYVVKAVNSIGEGVASNEASAAPAAGKVNQTITFGALAAKTYGDAPFALTATASSGLTVSYASSDELVASIAGSTVTIHKAGTATITASQAGDDDYHPATSVDQTLTVSKANQSLTFALGSRLVRGLNAVPFSDPATSSGGSGNPVTYSSSNEGVATVDSSGLVTLVGVGTTEIRADQLGDADHFNAAPQVAQTLNVISTPLPVLGGLSCWFDAAQGVTTDGSGVTVWADSSTLGHDAIRGGGTVTLVPNDVNSLPSVHLRGNNSFLNCTTVAFTSIVKEQYVVVRSPNATWNGPGSFFGRKSDTFLAVRASSYNMVSGSDGFWQDHFPTAVSKNGAPLAQNNVGGSAFHLAPITNFMILKIVVDNDGVANFAANPFYQIGRNETLATMDFDVAEIIGYSSALSATDGNLVTAYLAQKYAMAVAIPTGFSNLTASQSIGAGTASVTLSGTLSAPGPIYPAAGEVVSVTINGVTQTTTVSGAAGNFSIVFPTASIPFSVTPYPIQYSYAGNATNLGAAPNHTGTTLTVTEALAGYDAWANGTFANAFTDKDPADNQDGDTLSNLQEYAFGTDPTVPTTGEIQYDGNSVTTAGVPKMINEGGTYYAVFGRRADYLTAGILYSVRFSADLTNGYWVTSAVEPEPLTTTGAIRAVRVPYPGLIDSATGAQKARFFQVGVEQTP